MLQAGKYKVYHTSSVVKLTLCKFVCLFRLFVLLLYIPSQQLLVIVGRSVQLTALFPGQA